MWCWGIIIVSPAIFFELIYLFFNLWRAVNLGFSWFYFKDFPPSSVLCSTPIHSLSNDIMGLGSANLKSPGLNSNWIINSFPTRLLCSSSRPRQHSQPYLFIFQAAQHILFYEYVQNSGCINRRNRALAFTDTKPILF